MTTAIEMKWHGLRDALLHTVHRRVLSGKAVALWHRLFQSARRLYGDWMDNGLAGYSTKNRNCSSEYAASPASTRMSL